MPSFDVIKPKQQQGYIKHEVAKLHELRRKSKIGTRAGKLWESTQFSSDYENSRLGSRPRQISMISERPNSQSIVFTSNISKH
jgi:hypothetical protein